MMESQTGNMEDTPEEVYAYYNLPNRCITWIGGIKYFVLKTMLF